MAPEPSPHHRCRSIIAVFVLGFCIFSRIHAQSTPSESSKKRILGNEIGFIYKADDKDKLAEVLDSFGYKYQLETKSSEPDPTLYRLKPDETVGVVELKNPLAAPATLRRINNLQLVSHSYPLKLKEVSYQFHANEPSTTTLPAGSLTGLAGSMKTDDDSIQEVNSLQDYFIDQVRKYFLRFAIDKADIIDHVDRDNAPIVGCLITVVNVHKVVIKDPDCFETYRVHVLGASAWAKNGVPPDLLSVTLTGGGWVVRQGTTLLPAASAYFDMETRYGQEEKDLQASIKEYIVQNVLHRP